MRSQLDTITNWPALAKEAGYRPKKLAKRAGVCLRQLERWVRLKKNMTPREFCTLLRLTEAAAELPTSHKSMKELAAAYAYTQATNFSRDFRKFYGVTPRGYQDRLRASP